MPLNSVITNTGAQVALASFNKTAEALTVTQKRISTGYRVADAKDDGAAYAVAERVRGEVDLVLVDGRFRVACALAGLARLAPGALVMVHDFWSRAAYRAPLLRHYDLAGSAGTLALLSPRPAPDPVMLAADLVAHAFDPA